MNSTLAKMHALALTAPNKMEATTIPVPTVRPHEVLVKIGGVGLCGTDFHIYEGHANYNTDKSGRPVPLDVQPLILGHEFCGTVVEVGSSVTDLKVGDRVSVDQGFNCHTWQHAELCEYCVTGDSHQCQHYCEHGITGLQGALAEYVCIAAVNAIKAETTLSWAELAMVEPLSCITHSSQVLQQRAARYTFTGERRIKNILVCGAGPAGLLFTQYLRNVIGFDGNIIVTEPQADRRALAEGYGASATIDPIATDVVAAVQELTHGERIHCLIESAGVAPLYKQIPALIRKQATIVMYGHGHHGVDLGVMNNIQFIEPTVIMPTGASGGFDADRRPSVYRRSLELLSAGKINVSKFLTHQYTALEDVPRGFERDRFEPGYIKGVATF
jgi:threonine dehydrogenase-like Zn-dependent dehydrogenase